MFYKSGGGRGGGSISISSSSSSSNSSSIGEQRMVPLLTQRHEITFVSLDLLAVCMGP